MTRTRYGILAVMTVSIAAAIVACGTSEGNDATPPASKGTSSGISYHRVTVEGVPCIVASDSRSLSVSISCDWASAVSYP